LKIYLEEGMEGFNIKVKITDNAHWLIKEQTEFIREEYNIDNVVLAIRQDIRTSCESCSQSIGCTENAGNQGCGSGEVIQLTDKEDIEILNSFVEIEDVSNAKGMQVYIEKELLKHLGSEETLTIGAFEEYTPNKRVAELILSTDKS
jgi:hypothetical protein